MRKLYPLLLIAAQAVLPCINLNHPNVVEFKQALPDCKAWFFLGKGGAMVWKNQLHNLLT